MQFGSVIMPSSHKAEDTYQSSANHSRQAMMLRMEHLFDEIESKILITTPKDSAIFQILAEPSGDDMAALETGKARLPTKPIVIGDAVPMPSQCPEMVENLLEAALAHHNLGSFEESLKFLEAARINIVECDRSALAVKTSPTDITFSSVLFDIQMYIILCKGNVYQSCGDDEQSLLHFMEGYSLAISNADKDWEIICLNSIGVLAYYNVRYDIASLCFNSVSLFRETVRFILLHSCSMPLN
jgi:hypothetical protein